MTKFLQKSTTFFTSGSNKWQRDKLPLYLRFVIITGIIQYVTLTENKFSKKHNLTPFHRSYFQPHFYQPQINLLKNFKKNTLIQKHIKFLPSDYLIHELVYVINEFKEQKCKTACTILWQCTQKLVVEGF